MEKTMKQRFALYKELKKQYKDTLLLFFDGEHYEMYGQDKDAVLEKMNYMDTFTVDGVEYLPFGDMTLETGFARHFSAGDYKIIDITKL